MLCALVMALAAPPAISPSTTTALAEPSVQRLINASEAEVTASQASSKRCEITLSTAMPLIWLRISNEYPVSEKRTTNRALP